MKKSQSKSIPRPITVPVTATATATVVATTVATLASTTLTLSFLQRHSYTGIASRPACAIESKALTSIQYTLYLLTKNLHRHLQNPDQRKQSKKKANLEKLTMVLPHGPQTAGDCQIVYELDREAVERAAEYGTLEDEIQRQKTHISTLPNDSEEDDRSSDTRGSQVGTDYKYLEWTTPVEELCPNPGQLPRGVIEVVDPFRWGNTKKNVTLALCCASTFVAAYTAGAYTSGLAQMEVEWNMERVPLLVGVTCYTTGFAIAPMFLAPLSEVGRCSSILGSWRRKC